MAQHHSFRETGGAGGEWQRRRVLRLDLDRREQILGEGVVGFVLGEGDGDVRVEEVEELLGVVFDGGGDFVREEVLEHGVGEH